MTGLGGLAGQTVGRLLSVQAVSGDLSEKDCFLCKEFKNLHGHGGSFCSVTSVFVGISNKL